MGVGRILTSASFAALEKKIWNKVFSFVISKKKFSEKITASWVGADRPIRIIQRAGRARSQIQTSGPDDPGNLVGPDLSGAIRATDHVVHKRAIGRGKNILSSRQRGPLSPSSFCRGKSKSLVRGGRVALSLDGGRRAVVRWWQKLVYLTPLHYLRSNIFDDALINIMSIYLFFCWILIQERT